jgi:ATP phosphoribosyltransferase
MNDKLTIGIPKGSLQEQTLHLFSRAGFRFSSSSGRSLWLGSNDPEIQPVLLKPQEIPQFVRDGTLDCGLSGLDWITEMQCGDDIRTLADLCYSKKSFRPVRWVLAVPNDSKYETAADLEGKRIATELKRVTGDWLAKQRVTAEVEFSWGATEAKVPHFADAIVECAETGASLIENGLRIIETVFESTTQFFANKKCYKENERKRKKLDDISLLLKSCLSADGMINIRAHFGNNKPIGDLLATELYKIAPEGSLFSLTSYFKGRPTQIDLLVGKERVREVVPMLIAYGATTLSTHEIGLLYDERIK